jgi:glycosyltransferase involved in cell wall biosynthesis
LRWGLIPRLWRMFRRLKPQVVHTHQIGTLLYAGPAARLAAVPVVVHTEHGKHYADRSRTRALGRIAGRFVERFFCLTQDIASEVRARRIVPDRKIRVIPNGIDLTRFQVMDPKEHCRQACALPAAGPIIGTIGRMVALKRYDVLIRAFSRIGDSYPGAHLVLVGDGPLRPELVRLAERLKLSHRVHFPGHQSEPERYLRCMDVFALSSESEGMPQVIMEAAAAGIPIVASGVGGIPELIKHNESGLLVEPGDEEALAAGLHHLLGNPQLSSKLSRAAKERVLAHHGVNRMAGDYHRAFLELLALERTMTTV